MIRGANAQAWRSVLGKRPKLKIYRKGSMGIFTPSPPVIGCPTVDTITVVISGLTLDCGCTTVALFDFTTAFGTLTGNLNGSYSLNRLSVTPPGIPENLPVWGVTGPSCHLEVFEFAGCEGTPIYTSDPISNIYFYCDEINKFWSVIIYVPDPEILDPGFNPFEGDTGTLVSGGPFPNPGTVSNNNNCAFTQNGRGGTATVTF